MITTEADEISKRRKERNENLSREEAFRAIGRDHPYFYLGHGNKAPIPRAPRLTLFQKFLKLFR